MVLGLFLFGVEVVGEGGYAAFVVVVDDVGWVVMATVGLRFLFASMIFLDHLVNCHQLNYHRKKI